MTKRQQNFESELDSGMKRGSRTSLDSLDNLPVSRTKRFSLNVLTSSESLSKMSISRATAPSQTLSESSTSPSHHESKSGYHCRRKVLTTWELRKDRRFTYIFLLSLVILLLNADQNLLAPSLTTVAEDFNFTSEEKNLFLGGYLSLAFFLGGSVAAIIAGFAADISNRRLAFTVIVFLGEFSCFCTVFVTSYWGLFVTRLCTGISIGGSSPIFYSMIGDLFIDEWRGRAVSAVTIMGGGGVIVGQGISGIIAPIYGWRIPFAVVSIPAMALTLFFGWYTKEPTRGSAEQILKDVIRDDSTDETSNALKYSEIMTLTKFLQLMKSKTFLLLTLSSIPNSLPWGFLMVYAQDFLVHDVGPHVPGGISTDQSFLIVSMFGIWSGIGTIAGGMITDRLWKKKKKLVPLFSSIAILLGTGPMYILINVQTTFLGYILATIPSGFFVSVGQVSKAALLLNATLPETRGTCFALNTIVDDLGKGLGSFIVALFILAFGSRVPAFNIAMGGWIVAGVLFFLVTFTIKYDVDRNNILLLQAKEKMLEQRREALDTIPEADNTTENANSINNVEGSSSPWVEDQIQIV